MFNLSVSNLLLGIFFCLPQGELFGESENTETQEVVRKANIILMMCDDLGWGDVGFNGNQIIQTPHLDAMSRNGMKWNRFYAASAVCSPTRGSVVTGRHPYRYGIPTANAGHMKPEEHTLAELLGKLDYRTGHFGKWHLGTLTTSIKDSNRGGTRSSAHFSPPWKNGFEVCFSTEAKVPTYDPMLKPVAKASNKGWDYLKNLSAAVPYGTYYWNHQGKRLTENLLGDDSKIIMDRAIPFIEQAIAEGSPFFAIVWFHAPHLPVVAGPRHSAQYAQYDSYPKNYFGCITAMDEQVGRLRATLKRLNVSENTLLAFCSDNGPEGNSKAPGSSGVFRGRKRDLYEGGIRVPSLMEWPAVIPAGSQTDFPAVTSDYLPTILDILNIKPLDSRPMDGMSLLPVIKGELLSRPKPIGFEFGGKLALSDNRFKLVYYPEKKRGKKDSVKQEIDLPAYQLYDLLADPFEKKDLASLYPETVWSMARQLSDWRVSCRQSDDGADY